VPAGPGPGLAGGVEHRHAHFRSGGGHQAAQFLQRRVLGPRRTGNGGFGQSLGAMQSRMEICREMLRGGGNPFLSFLGPAGLDGSDLPVAYGEHNGEAGKQDQECTLTPPRQRP